MKVITAKIRKAYDGTGYREVVIRIARHEFTTASLLKEEAINTLADVREALEKGEK